MAYIYQITNIVNGNIYIGKTSRSIKERWKEHLKDCDRINIQNRPLYLAINKYGKENFIIEEIEECSDSEASDREKYWIEKTGSFKNGYNATIGGDGKPYLDYELIYKVYSECKSRTKTAELLHIDRSNVNRIIASFKTNPYKNHESLFKPVARLDPHSKEILEIFSSIAEANKKYKCSNHIGPVCQGKRKTAGGYGWKYL